GSYFSRHPASERSSYLQRLRAMAATAQQLGQSLPGIVGTAGSLFAQTSRPEQSTDYRRRLYLDRAPLEAYQSEDHHPARELPGYYCSAFIRGGVCGCYAAVC